MSYMRDSKGRRLDTLEVLNTRYLDAIRIRSLPGVIDARMNDPYNVQQQEQTCVGGGFQYAVHPDGAAAVNVSQRTYPTGEFAATSFSGRSDVGYLSTPVFYDEHNGLCLARDGAGIVHVMGNMHGSFMAYARTTAADVISGSAGTWTAPGVIGSGNDSILAMRADEKQVSYPRLVPLPNGDLLLFYRNGVSGDGDEYLNYWDHTARTWTRVGVSGTPPTTANFLVGSTASPTARSPYLHKISYRTLTNGSLVIGVGWTWRLNGGDATSTTDMCYLQCVLTTTDLATPAAAKAKLASGWTSVSGTAVTLPLTVAGCTGSIVALHEGTYNGMDAGQGMDLDTSGYPHITMPVLISGASGHYQIRHLYWDGAAWQSDTATSWTDVFTSQAVRPTIFCTNDGRTYILTNWFTQGWRDGLRLIDCTTGHSHQTSKIVEMPLRVNTPSVDLGALRTYNSLEMLLGPCSDYPVPIAGIGFGSGPSVGDMWSLEQWQQQPGMVVSIDVAQLEQVQSRRSHRVRVRTIATGGSVPANTALTTVPAFAAGSGPSPAYAPAGVQIVNSQSLVTAPELRGKALVARMHASASIDVTGKLGWLELAETSPGSSARVLARLPFSSTTSGIKGTVWVPLQLGPGDGTGLNDGRLLIYGCIQSLTHVITITGSPTGGTWVPTWLGKAASGNTGTTSLAVAATAAQVKTCLAELLKRYLIGLRANSGGGTPDCTDLITVTGSNGGPWTVVVTPISGQNTMYLVPPGLITVANTFTGGSSPAIAVTNATGTLTVQGASVELGVIEAL